MDIMRGKCDSYDTLSVLTGFLLAFAFEDTVNMDSDSFNSQAAFIVYSVCLMCTVLFGALSIVTLSFICIRLRRQLSRDAAAPLYFKPWRLYYLRNGKHASHARTWYYGRYFDDPDNLQKKQKDAQKRKSCLFIRPVDMIRKGVTGFLLMIIFYAGSIYVSVFDTYYQLFDSDEMSRYFMIIPSLWAILSVCGYIFLGKWLYDFGALTDVA